MQCSLFINKYIASIIVLLFGVLLIPFYNIAVFNAYSLSGVERCPLCLGESICSSFISGSFTLDWSYFWINLLNVGLNLQRKKSVIFGKYDDKIVVLKRVSMNFNIDNSYSTYANVTNTFSDIVDKLKPFLTSNVGYISHKLNFCPSDDRFEVLLMPFSKSEDNITHIYFNIQYMLEVNIEPIIQQVTEHWAVAPYLGSCGFIAVFEYCGDSLTRIAPKLNWSQRALVAIQLLEFAFNATFDNPNFAFYFTDMTADNFAVSSSKKVRLVDLENVIIVDKLAQGTQKHWNEGHQIHHHDDYNEFDFSMDEICSHQISDLNIYSICQGILSERADLITAGLLHSPPPDVQGLRVLIEECISPKIGNSRFEVAQSIMGILKAR